MLFQKISNASPLFKAIRIVMVVFFLVSCTVLSPGQQTAWAEPGISPANILSDYSVPLRFGNIKESFTGANGKTIIHIQDAHCNYSAQHSLANIVDYVNTNYGIDLVFMEGGHGEYDLSLFSDIADKTVREQVTDYFVKEGRINGPEYFAINSSYRVELFGIENPKLYAGNLEVYRNSLSNKNDADKCLDFLSNGISNCKERMYSPKLKELGAVVERYRDGDVELKEYVEFFVGKAKDAGVETDRYAGVNALIKVVDMEKDVDFKRAEKEREDLIDRLELRLSKRDLERLIVKTVQLKEGDITREDFYGYIFTKANLAGVNYTDFPNLVKFSEYVKEFELIDKAGMLKELDVLVDSVTVGFFETEDQETLYELDNNLNVMKDMFSVALVKDEYDLYKKNKKAYRVKRFTDFFSRNAPQYGLDLRVPSGIDKLDKYRDNMGKFYEYSLKRDDAFINNIETKMNDDKKDAAILVTGGFHTGNLKELFNKRGYSYIEVMPKLKVEADCPYFRLLAGDRSEFDEFAENILTYSPKKSNIAIQSLFSEMGINRDEERMISLEKEIFEKLVSNPESDFIVETEWGLVVISQNEKDLAVPGFQVSLGDRVLSASVLVGESESYDLAVPDVKLIGYDFIVMPGTEVSFAKEPGVGRPELEIQDMEVSNLIEGALQTEGLEGLEVDGMTVNLHVLDSSHTGAMFEVNGMLNMAMRIGRVDENIIDVYVTGETMGKLKADNDMLMALVLHEAKDDGRTEMSHRLSWGEVKTSKYSDGMKRFIKYAIDNMPLEDVLTMITEYENDKNGKGEGRIKAKEWGDFEKDIYKYSVGRVAVSVPQTLDDLVRLFGVQRMIHVRLGSSEMVEAGINSDIIEAMAKAWDADRFTVEARIANAMLVYRQLQAVKSENDAVKKKFEAGTNDATLLELAEQTHESWLGGESDYARYDVEMHLKLAEHIRAGKITSAKLEDFTKSNKKFKFEKKDLAGLTDSEFSELTGKERAAFADDDMVINTAAGSWAADKEGRYVGVTNWVAHITPEQRARWYSLMGWEADVEGEGKLKKWSDERDKYLYELQADNVGAIVSALQDADLVKRLATGTEDGKRQAIVDILRKVNAGWRLNNPWGGFTDRLINKPFGVGEGTIGIDDVMKDMVVLQAILEVLRDNLDQSALDPSVKTAITAAYAGGLADVMNSMTEETVLSEAVEQNMAQMEVFPSLSDVALAVQQDISDRVKRGYSRKDNAKRGIRRAIIAQLNSMGITQEESVDVYLGNIMKLLGVEETGGRFYAVLAPIKPDSDQATIANSRMIVIPRTLDEVVALFGEQATIDNTLNFDIISAMAKAWDMDLWEVEARIANAMGVYRQVLAIKSANDDVKDKFEAGTNNDILLELAEETHQSWLGGENEKPTYVAYTKTLQNALLEQIRKGKIVGITEAALTNDKKKHKIKKGDLRGLTDEEFFSLTGKYRSVFKVTVSEENFAEIENAEGLVGDLKKRGYINKEGVIVDTNVIKDRDLDGEWSGRKDEVIAILQKALYGVVVINTVAGEWSELSGWNETRDSYLYGIQADNVGSIVNALQDADLVERLTTGTKEGKRQAIVDILRKVNAGWRLNNPWGGFTDRLINKPFGIGEGAIGIDDVMKDMVVLQAILEVLRNNLDQSALDSSVKTAITAAYANGLAEVMNSMTDKGILEIEVEKNISRSAGNRHVSFAKMPGVRAVQTNAEQLRGWRDGLKAGTLKEVAVMSDIHGNLGNAQKLIDQYLRQGVRRFQFCGDFIDLDVSENLAVVKVIRQLSEGDYVLDGRPVGAVDVQFVLGNHDMKFVQSMMGDLEAFEGWVRTGGLYVLDETGINATNSEAFRALKGIEDNVQETMAGQSAADIGRAIGKGLKEYMANHPEEMSDMFERTLASPELIDQAKWLFENGNLYNVDEKGILYVHAGLPVDLEGNVTMTLDEVRVLQTEFEGLGKLFDPENVASEEDKSVLNQVVAFVDNKDKEKGIKALMARLQANPDLADQILAQLGVNGMVFGHVKQNALFVVGRTKIFGIDLKMTRSYDVKRKIGHGGALLFGNQGIVPTVMKSGEMSLDEANTVSKDELLADLDGRIGSSRLDAVTTAFETDVVVLNEEGGMRGVNAGKELTEEEVGRDFMVNQISKAGAEMMDGVYGNLLGGQELYDFAIGAVPSMIEPGEELVVEGRMDKVRSAANNFIKRKRVGNLNQNYSLGIEEARGMIAIILGHVKANIGQERLHVSLSSSILNNINEDEALLKSIKGEVGKDYVSIRQFLTENVMLDIIEDSIIKDGQENIYPMPYGRIFLMGLSRFNIAHVEKTSPGDAVARNDAIRSYAFAMALVSNNVGSVVAITDALIAKAEKDPRNFFKIVLEIALPAVAKINLNIIKEGFEAEVEVLRSL